LQAHVFVFAPVDVQAAVAAHPPLFTPHELIPVQVVPSPEYPALHEQLFAPGPVIVHAALASHPP
jgi:hypothetical protein